MKKNDINTPYSYAKWIELNNIFGDISFKYYNEYLRDWYNTEKESINSCEIKKLDFIYFLKQLTILFKEDFEKEYFKNINFNDAFDVEFILPQYSKKIREIALSIIMLRKELKEAKLKYNMYGSVGNLEKIFYEYLLNVFTKNKSNLNIDYQIYKNLPDLSSVKNDFKIEVEELYDDTNYFDKDPSLKFSDYYTVTSNEINNFFLSGLLFKPQEEFIDWLYTTGFTPLCTTNPLLWSLTNAISTYNNIIENNLPVSSYYNFINEGKTIINNYEISQKYMGEILYMFSSGFYEKPSDTFRYDFEPGNNWFYFPSGEYIVESDNKLVFPIMLTATNLVSSGATGGSNYREADRIFVQTGSLLKGAWLNSSELTSSVETMSCYLPISQDYSFRFPFPGYGLSSEFFDWTGKDIANVNDFNAFNLYDTNTKNAILKKYWNTLEENRTISSIKLNDTTLIDCSATPGLTFEDADSLYIRNSQNYDKLHDENPGALYQDGFIYSWLYKMLSSDIPIQRGKNYIYWPLWGGLNIEDLTFSVLSSHCTPICLSSINTEKEFTGARAGYGLADADILYKVKNKFGLPMECAWLSGIKLRDFINIKYPQYYNQPICSLYENLTYFKDLTGIKQGGINLKCKPGTVEKFIWCGDNNFNFNNICKFIKHQDDCKYKTISNKISVFNQRNNKEYDFNYPWRDCECKSIIYSPIGHPGEIFDEYDGMCDIIVLDTQFPNDFDLLTWRGDDGKSYLESSDFGWYKITEKYVDIDVGTGPGHFVSKGLTLNEEFKLKTGRQYIYLRTNLGRSINEVLANYVPYTIVKHIYQDEFNPVWIKAQLNEDNEWYESSDNSEMLLEADLYYVYDHIDTNWYCIRFPGDRAEWDVFNYEISAENPSNNPWTNYTLATTGIYIQLQWPNAFINRENYANPPVLADALSATQWNILYPSSITSSQQVVFLVGTGANGKIARSTDNASTWLDLGQQSSQETINALVQMENGKCSAGTGYTTAKILSSSDYGQTWGEVELPISSETVINTMSYLYNGIIIAGTYPNGKIIRSTDYGLSWSEISHSSSAPSISSSAYLEDENSLFGTDNYLGAEIFYSDNYGISWTSSTLPLGFSETTIGSFCNIGNGYCLAGTGPNAKIIRSSDYGQNWIDDASYPTYTNTEISSLIYLDEGICLAGTAGDSGGKILRSVDYGGVWNEITLPTSVTETRINSFYQIDPGIIIAGTYPNGKLLKSTDYGLTWVDFNTIIGENTIFTISKGDGPTITTTTEQSIKSFNVIGTTFDFLPEIPGTYKITVNGYLDNSFYSISTYPFGYGEILPSDPARDNTAYLTGISAIITSPYIPGGSTPDIEIISPVEVISHVVSGTYDIQTIYADTINFPINVSLSGWDYTNFIADENSPGAKPFWAVGKDDSSIETKYKGVRNYGGNIRTAYDYVLISQPDFSTYELKIDDVITYSSKNSLTWIQPILFNNSETKNQWMKLSCVGNVISPLSSHLKNIDKELVIYPLMEESDIILNQNDYINYYALNQFTWYQELSSLTNTSSGTLVPIVTSLLMLPENAEANLLNRHYPSIAIAPYVGDLYNQEKYGGYFTPKCLGINTFLGKKYKNQIEIDYNIGPIDNRGGSEVYRDINEYVSKDLGLTDKRQTGYINNIFNDSSWMKGKLTEGNSSGIIKDVSKFKDFTPYQSNYENNEFIGVGLNQNLKKYDPWNGEYDNEWEDSINYPPDFRGLYPIEKWYNSIINIGYTYTWKTDIFGYNYGLIKEKGNSQIENKNNLGYIYARDLYGNISNLIEATSSQSYFNGLTSRYSNINYEISSQVKNFDIWGDNIMIQTSSYLYFDKLILDENINKVEFSGQYSFIKSLSSDYNFIDTWYFEEKDKVLVSFYNLSSISGNLVLCPEFYKYNLINDYFIKYPINDYEDIYQLSAYNLNNIIENPCLTFNNENNKIYVSYLASNSLNNLYIINYEFKYYDYGLFLKDIKIIEPDNTSLPNINLLKTRSLSGNNLLMVFENYINYEIYNNVFTC